MRLILVFAISSVLVACGGSSSSSEPSQTDSTTTITETDASSEDADLQNPADDIPTDDDSNPGTVTDNQPLDQSATDDTETEIPDDDDQVDDDQVDDEQPAETPSTTLPIGTNEPLQLLLKVDELIPGTVGTTLTAINETSLSNNSWLAVHASTETAGVSESGIWRGQNGSLELVVNSGGMIDGLPNNIFLQSFSDIEITDDSTIWAEVALGGAASGESAVVKITPEGEVLAQIRSGDSIPNTASGITSRSIRGLISAGNDAFVLVNSDTLDNYLIHLTTEDQTIVASTNSTYTPSGNQLPEELRNCSVATRSIGVFARSQISTSGAVVFEASALGRGCPLKLLLQYENGVYTTHIDDEQLLPVNDGSTISDITIHGFAADNQALISSNVSTPDDDLIPTLGTAIFLTSNSAEPRLVMFNGETLPPDFNDRVNIQLLRNSREFSFQSGGRVTTLFPLARSNGLFVGSVREQQPYETYLNLGASQFNRIIAEDLDNVVGLDDTSFYSNLENLLMNEAGQIWFTGEASVTDQSNARVTFDGMWRVDPGQEPMLELRTREPLTFGDREPVTLNGINGYDANDDNDLLISASEQFATSVLLFRKGSN